jgi:hypothetical protein
MTIINQIKHVVSLIEKAEDDTLSVSPESDHGLAWGLSQCALYLRKRYSKFDDFQRLQEKYGSAEAAPVREVL